MSKPIKRRKQKKYTLSQVNRAVKLWKMIWVVGQGRNWKIDWYNFRHDLEEIRKGIVWVRQ